ncbi:hypothetical protein C8F04DRAFT_1067361 [Mycena alexandri]|uniref:F-box domain-containing protein n=1 Tax=Mycena alexandri TaxID=1745969 RepID=A0AAD6XAA9_9AGAR|nr:hypothetical protein C8F04DRAFT_1067361 [Mycena alexandri]
MLAKFKQRLRSRRSAAQEPPVLDGIYLLPSEILGGEIFPLVVRAEIHDKIHNDFWHRKLLALAGVCTQWRNIVHSTPFLWNQHIPINTRQFSGVGRFRRNRLTKKYFEALRMCLARSAPLPLSISIDDWLVFPGDRKDFARAVDLISNAAVRMEVLRINIRCRDDAEMCILRALERIPTGAFQALTEIDFVFPSDVELVPFSVMSAPHLRRVKLNAGPDPLKFMSIPWPQLTHLTLTAPPLACLAVLARCNNLVSAVLHHMYTSLPDDTAPTTATLVHLTSLRLTVSSTLIQAVGNLVLPALTTLELIYDDEDMIWPQLEVFRQLPLHNIQCLTFEFNDEDMPESATLCALLRCTPSVTELKLKECDCIDNALLNALRGDGPRSKLLLPQLELFSIDWGSSMFSDNFDSENWKVMLASRVGVGLRRIVYRGNYYGQVSALAVYHVDGLQVDVSGVKSIIII